MLAASPVLMIHGAGGGPWEWDVWSPRLVRRGFAPLAVDLLPNELGLEMTGLDDYSGQVVAAAAHHVGRVVLVGASLGGLLAAMVCSVVRPRAVVLVNPLPPTPWQEAVRPAQRHPLVIPWARSASMEATRAAIPDADDATIAMATARWRDESGGVLNQALDGVDVPKPDCPVLVISGSDDIDVPPSVSRALAEAWSADFVLGRGVSHVGPLLGTRAAHFADFTASWLAGCVGI